MASDSVLEENPAPVADIRSAHLRGDLIVVFLGGLFVIAFLCVCQIASTIIMPVVLAGILKLVLQPLMRRLEHIHVPRSLSAFLMIVLLLGVFAGLGAAFSVPATSWMRQFPAAMPRLQENLKPINAMIKAGHKLMKRAEGFTDTSGTDGGHTMTVITAGSSMSDKLLAGLQRFGGELFTMIVVLFFMLMSGDTFLRRLVEILPRFEDKKQAINISQQIESDISAYLTTVTVMNAVVGTITSVIMYFCGVPTPLLWGVVAFLFNYIPILGPLVCFALFAVVGLMSVDQLGPALLPACLYLAVHLVEGEAVTPMLLARRFTLNPVLVIITLVFWYWMWGVPGAVLSTPMLAIVKIICDRIDGLKPFGHFIEG